jgi:hypothetical protein
MEMSTVAATSDLKPQSSIHAKVATWADWVAYAGIVFACFLKAWIGSDGSNGDTIAYFDLSDAIQHHLWRHVVNASWFPGYPVLLALTRALFGYRLQYDLLAARLLDFVLWLTFVAAAIALAAAIRRLMLARGIKVDELLPARTLYLWVATFAYFFLSIDLLGVKPDTLLSALMIFSASALILGIANESMAACAVAGLLAGGAFWTKSFAFPFFCLMILFAALVNLRNYRVLRRLAASFVIFAIVAGPYIWQISAAKGRFTIGDSGRVNVAWYVNGAERFNPVNDSTVYSMGQAAGRFKHPGELLSKCPEIAYFGGDKVYGAMPQWDDFSFWSDGIAPRIVLHQYLSAAKVNLLALGNVLPMRLQALLLVVALYLWGFRIRRRSLADPILLAAVAVALACVGLYLVVHLEIRYVAFAWIMLGTLFAACSLNKNASANSSLHLTVLLVSCLISLYGIQLCLHEQVLAREAGDNPAKGMYEMASFNAGTALASHYSPGTEVACMGHSACFGNMLWARFGSLRVTTVISMPHREETGSAEQYCQVLQNHPAALDLLRKRDIPAIVARFGNARPCSAEWQPVGNSGDFFYLPLMSEARPQNQ